MSNGSGGKRAKPFEAVHRYEDVGDGVRYTNLRTGETRIMRRPMVAAVAEDRRVARGASPAGDRQVPESPAAARARRWCSTLGRKVGR